MKTNSEILKLSRLATNNTVKCKCGHSIAFIDRNNKKICSWCGRLVYKSQKEKLKEELMKRGIKINE